MVQPIKQKTGFFEDTFKRYLLDSPDEIQRSNEIGSGHITVLDAYSDTMDIRSGYMPYTSEYTTTDPDFNWVEQAEEDGYEKFIPHMAQHEIKNKLQYDVLTKTINDIQTLGQQLNQSDRFWGPMIAAQFLQLETYALAPFTFGSGVGLVQAVKGAFKLGATNIITEIPRENTRRYYDPYHNETHTATIFGLSGAIGGVMGFMPPVIRGAAKAYRGKGVGKTNIYDDMSNEKLVKETFKEWGQKYNQDIDLEFNLKIPGVSRQAVIKPVKDTGKYIDLRKGTLLSDRTKTQRRLSKTDLYVPVKFTKDDLGKEVIEIDEVWMEIYWQNFRKGKNVPNIPPEMNKFIKTKSDFQNFVIRKEIYRDLEFVDNLPTNLKQRELMFNARVMDDLIEENQMSFQTEELLPPINIETNHFKLDINPVNMMNRMMEKMVPLTKYNNNLKSNPKLYFKANHLIGSLLNDNGIRIKAVNKGININDSVVTSRDTIWGKVHLDYEDEINTFFREYLGNHKRYTSKLNQALVASGESMVRSGVKKLNKAKETLKNTKNKLLNKHKEEIQSEESFAEHMSIGEFREQIGRLSSDVNLFETSNIPELKKAVIARRKYYKTYRDVIERENLMGYKALEEQFTKINKRMPALSKKLAEAEKGSGKKYLYQRTFDEYKKRLDYLDEIFDIKDGVIVKKPMPDGDVSLTGILPMNETNQTFFHRIFNREAWENNPLFGKKLIANDLITYNPEAAKFKKMPAEQFIKIVNGKYNRIISREAAHGDELNMMEMGKDKKINPTMHRTLYGPNKSFMAEETGGIDFILTDALEVDRIYQQQMGTAIQMKRIFGDKTGFLKKLELEEDIADLMEIEKPSLNLTSSFPFVRDIKKKITGKISIEEVNAIIGTFEDQVFNLYGLHNRIPSHYLSKRIVENIMNWTVSDTMGNAGLSGMAEMARRTTVAGLNKVGFFPGRSGHLSLVSGEHGKSLKALTDATREALNKQASEYYTHMEIISAQGYMSRLVSTDMGVINKNKGSNIASRLINKAEQVNRGMARATYVINGQTHLTHFLKESQSGYISHLFIKDLLALHKGKLPVEDIQRLSNYGLGRKDAKIINDLSEKGIIEKVSKPGRNDLFLGNIGRWGEVKGGDDISERYINAIKNDVERTIVTPGYADKPNMMFGRVRIDNQKITDYLGKSKLLKELNKYSGGFLGEFHATGRGGVYENPLLIPILQFYTFTMGANRKILRNLATERGLYAGVSAAMTYAWLANNLKYGWYWDLDWQQQMYMAYETSGVGGVFSDLPRVIETESNGKYGLRQLLGVDELDFMQDQDRRGASFIGIGPSKLRDLYGALSSGDALESSNQTTYNLPFQNQFILKRGWQVLGGQDGTPYRPLTDWLFDVDRDKLKRRNTLRKKDR